MEPNEGYIKYHINFDEKKLSHGVVSDTLISYRNTLAKQNLIGCYTDGVSYGNLSERCDTSTQFIISGTQTGRKGTATAHDFCRVKSFDILQNTLSCEGLVRASSEALTHAAFYISSARIHAVIHVHHFQLWQKLLHTVPSTHVSIPYGTPAMAEAVQTLLKDEETFRKNILVTAGHTEGIFTFGKNLKEAYEVLMRYVQMNHY